MPRLLTAVVALCTILALSCGDDDPGATNGATDAGSLTTARAIVETSIPEEKPTEAPTPEPSEVTVANEPVSVETTDGVVIEGRLYAPEGPKRQALVIVAPVEQSTWAESIEAFTSEGIAVFTFDPRGFGETGGAEDNETLAADAIQMTQFVMSREYPLVYLIGVGEIGAAAAAKAAGSLEDLTGLVTYGFPIEADAANQLSLASDASWSGEDVLAEPEVREMVLEFVLGEN